MNLKKDCVLLAYTKDVMEKCLPFSCAENDLDDFFLKDAILYDKELLGKSYCWVTKSAPHRIVVLFTLANDSIKTKLLSPNDKNRLQRSITNTIRRCSYPAVIIGRLGVNKEFQGSDSHIGSQLLAFIQGWFKPDLNKSACRFVLVDALNNERVLNFYQKNGFKFVYKTDEIEKAFIDIPPDESLKTRLMNLDLKP